MPLFEFQYEGRRRDKEGKEILIPASTVLARSGPVIQVAVSVTPEHLDVLKAAGRDVPAAVVGFALIDTGASITGVSEEVCQSLGLRPTGVATIHGVGGEKKHNCYAVMIQLPDPLKPIVGHRVVSFRDLAGNPPPILLLGRDLLHRFKITYNGPYGRLEMDF